MKLAKRRFLLRSQTLLVLVIFALIYRGLDAARLTPSEFSGWMLLAIIGLLITFKLKRQLIHFPRYAASNWLQAHIYSGTICGFVFFEHIQWRIPNGLFESLLAGFISMTLITGVTGIFLNRRLAKRLTHFSEEFIYERIPATITQIRIASEQLVLEATEKTGSSTLAQFYMDQLAHRSYAPVHYWRHMLQSYQPIAETLLTQRERYMNTQELEYSAKLRSLLKRKTALDAHHAIQKTLKSWPLIHVPFAFATLLLIAVHVLMVYSFGAA